MPLWQERFIPRMKHADGLDLGAIAIRRVRELRAAKGLTQQQLAERADLTAEAVTRVERGVRVPTLATIAKLAHGLGVSPAELLATAPSGREERRPSRHVARVIAKLEDADAVTQEAAAEVVVAFLHAVDRTRRRRTV